MIKHIKGGYEETLKKATTTYKWTSLGYIDESGNLLKNNKDHSKIMKFIAGMKKIDGIPKYSLGKGK